MDMLSNLLIKAHLALGHQIRSCAHGQYKSGQWGTVTGTEKWSDRVVWEIVWPDGARDHWNVNDPDANYEIVNINEVYRTADNAIDALTQIAGAVHLDDATPGIRAPRDLRNAITAILKDWQEKTVA
jgi:hypothetical protein